MTQRTKEITLSFDFFSSVFLLILITNMAPYTMGSTFNVLEIFMIALDKYHYQIKLLGKML